MPPTNRDLYLAINSVAGESTEPEERDLETYLRALLPLCRGHAGAPGLSVEEFIQVLEAAFSAPPLPYDPSWADAWSPTGEDLPPFREFERILLRQIVDLREMQAAGVLDRPWVEFGVDSPRGSRWYNVTPRLYLECAAAGALGGWEPGDDTGRQLVPGPVAVMAPDGSITSVDAADVSRPIFPVPEIGWPWFADFLECGQAYE